jgi:hypothetical protein
MELERAAPVGRAVRSVTRRRCVHTKPVVPVRRGRYKMANWTITWPERVRERVNRCGHNIHCTQRIHADGKPYLGTFMDHSATESDMSVALSPALASSTNFVFEYYEATDQLVLNVRWERRKNTLRWCLKYVHRAVATVRARLCRRHRSPPTVYSGRRARSPVRRVHRMSRSSVSTVEQMRAPVVCLTFRHRTRRESRCVRHACDLNFPSGHVFFYSSGTSLRRFFTGL